MKISTYVFLLFITLFFTSCNENKKKIVDASLTPVESNTPVIVQDKKPSAPKEDPNRYILSDMNARDLNVTFKEQKLSIKGVKEPIVLLNFFAPWSAPCRAELPQLDTLQKKYNKNLFILGIVVDEKQDKTEFRYLMKKLNINYYLSISQNNQRFINEMKGSLKLADNFPIPLSVLYIHGVYHRLYEGTMPIEMLEYEVKQAIQKL